MGPPGGHEVVEQDQGAGAHQGDAAADDSAISHGDEHLGNRYVEPFAHAVGGRKEIIVCNILNNYSYK